MRCLAALAEWEQLATLCAREWELSAGVGAPGAGGVGAGGDAVLRGRMAPRRDASRVAPRRIGAFIFIFAWAI